MTLKLENTTDEDIILYLPPEYYTNANQNGIEDGSYIKVADEQGFEIAHEKIKYGEFYSSIEEAYRLIHSLL